MIHGPHANPPLGDLPSEPGRSRPAADETPQYCGRFAPSPTGPLHVGSLIAALASCLSARTRRGRWLVRIDDLDGPRCSSAATSRILRSLDAYGFVPDAEIVWQSRRSERYAAALTQLQERGLAYPCACSRRELADSAIGRDGAGIYPGTCRDGLPAGRAARAWRLRVAALEIKLVDRIQGPQVWALARDAGDFIIRRADGLFAYQLATVVDDAEAGVTDIVRGADLLDSTPRQLWLQRCLELPAPSYAHLPVATNAQGEKLSKQTLAAPLDDSAPVPTLCQVLRFLGQNPPDALARATLASLWDWALAHWNESLIPARLHIPWEP